MPKHLWQSTHLSPVVITPPPQTMLPASSPVPRCSSPAMSEISVGSPSPPPPTGLGSLQHHHSAAFRPLNMKRMRLSHERAATPTHVRSAALAAAVPTARRKSSAERVKSFSIADILGKKDDVDTSVRESEPTSSNATATSLPIAAPTLLPAQLLNERLQPPPHLLLDAAMPATLSKVVHHWDPMRGPIPLGPFFPPALLHYEQRLAWDYQRQLQEHFQAQAQLLRQMSMDPTIIPSEDGSERSNSSSTGSDCCSPEVNVSSSSTESRLAEKASGGGDATTQRGDRTAQYREKAAEKTKKTTGDTPLDALFQLSTKNFDEEQDPATLNIFATRPNPKKKRKSRTAFTNHQIFELEKRFLYQKYLSPADRDEIAGGLGLSNAQVITWFQNRRAKLKRDMEELKKDVESVKQLSAHKGFLENVNDFSILKTRPVSRHQPPATPTSTAPAAATAAAALGNPQPTCYTHATLSPSVTSACVAIENGRGSGANESAQPSRMQLNNSRG